MLIQHLLQGGCVKFDSLLRRPERTGNLYAIWRRVSRLSGGDSVRAAAVSPRDSTETVLAAKGSVFGLALFFAHGKAPQQTAARVPALPITHPDAFP